MDCHGRNCISGAYSKKLVKFFDKHLVGRGTIGLDNFVPTLYWCGAIILLSI